MIHSADNEYKLTKQIMLGKSSINPDFLPLADFIDKTFNVRPINIVYDSINNGTRPRIGIYFELEREKQSFYENNGVLSFDSSKQKLIADKFRQSIIEQGLNSQNRFFDFWAKPKDEKYQVENIVVYYSAFEPIAKEEANRSISQEKITQLQKELDCNDLWEISKCFSETTFFLYTDEQVKEYKNSDARKMWANKYFDLLEAYNQFGYFKRAEFNIHLDSKENFDNNYQGNWFYYYR